MATENLNSQLKLGRGKLYLAPCPVGGELTDAREFRYIGNAPEFSVTFESETLPHYQSTGGIREQDASVELQVNRSGAIVTDNIDNRNLARFFFGSSSALSQVSSSVADEAITVLEQGAFVQLGVSASNIVGVRGIENVVVTSDPAGTTFVEGTDYNVLSQVGAIEIIEGGAITASTSILVDYDLAVQTRDRIISGNQPVLGALQYVEDNPVGSDSVIKMPYVKVRPNGDYNLIGEEWQTLPFSIEVLKLANYEAVYVDGEPYTP